MSTLQTEPAGQNNSKILPVKIKIGFSPLFSTFFSFILLAGADIFYRAEGLDQLMLYMHTLTQQSGCLATGYYRLPQCCQLLADFSGQFGGKFRPLRKQIGPIAISPF